MTKPVAMIAAEIVLEMPAFSRRRVRDIVDKYGFEKAMPAIAALHSAGYVVITSGHVSLTAKGRKRSHAGDAVE